MDKLDLVTVYTSQGMLAAQVVKGKLESAGIPVLLKYEALGQIVGLTVDGLGRVRVQVPGHLAEQALILVQEEDEDLLPEDDSGNETAGAA